MQEGVARAGATGVTIIGGLANKLDTATNAALAPVVGRPAGELREASRADVPASATSHALDIQNGKITFEVAAASLLWRCGKLKRIKPGALFVT